MLNCYTKDFIQVVNVIISSTMIINAKHIKGIQLKQRITPIIQIV